MGQQGAYFAVEILCRDGGIMKAQQFALLKPIPINDLIKILK
jgi:hypothetical protein